MIYKGQKVLIGTTARGARVYGIVIWIHPQHLFALTERTAPYGNIIRECVMIGRRRGQLTNRVVGNEIRRTDYEQRNQNRGYYQEFANMRRQ